MIGGEPYTLGLFDTAGEDLLFRLDTGTLTACSFLFLPLLFGILNGRFVLLLLLQVKKIMTVCDPCLTRRRTFSLYVFPLCRLLPSRT